MRRSTTEIVTLAPSRRALLTLLIGATTTLLAAPSWSAEEDRHVTLYKEPQCGCCESYADYLQKRGFMVSIVPTHDLPLLDEKYGIPSELSPCHISLIGGYVVGGHVPIEIVNRLLAEKPAITGVTLPGMPLGSPGMTGRKTEPFKIYEISKGASKIYAIA